MALCRAVKCYYHHRFTWQNLHHIWVILSNSTKSMVKIKIYVTFTPCRGEKSDFHHTVVKSQIFTMLWWKVRFSPRFGEKTDLHHAMVRSQIFTRLWWEVRFRWHLHHAVVKIEIYMTFTPCRGENSDLHNIFTMLWWKVRFTPRHGEKTDLHHAMVKGQIYIMPW